MKGWNGTSLSGISWLKISWMSRSLTVKWELSGITIMIQDECQKTDSIVLIKLEECIKWHNVTKIQCKNQVCYHSGPKLRVSAVIFLTSTQNWVSEEKIMLLFNVKKFNGEKGKSTEMHVNYKCTQPPTLQLPYPVLMIGAGWTGLDQAKTGWL